MRPIAIFYHVYMGGGQIPCDKENVTNIVTDQLMALRVSKLLDNSNHFSVGVSGTDEDSFMVGMMAGVEAHLNVGVGELPTMRRMQDWCKDHPGVNVLYFHTKGAIYKGHQVYVSWRECMENAVIWRWRDCVADLNNGLDSSGAHWLTPQQYPIIGPWAYWGGNFFWAKSEFLNTLPPIDVNADRYQAEVWIGRGPRRPRVRDYAMHWPGALCMH